MSKRKCLLSIVLSIIIFVTACTTALPTQPPTPVEPGTAVLPTMALPNPTTADPTQSMPQSSATLSAVQEPTAAVTEAPPTATQQPDVVLDGKEIMANGIRFFLPKNVAADSYGTVNKGKPVTADSPFWEKMPDHFLFLFKDYQHPNSMHQPRLFIWPVAEYIAANPGFEATFNLLKSLIATNSSVDLSTADLPFPPLFNAGKVVSLVPEFLQFQNGSGLRYLTFFAQAVTPITNKGLFYTYQGITADEKYYIAAILPVSQAQLEADDSKIPVDAALYDNYQTYLTQIKDQMTAAPNESFAPDLKSLDTMMQSLEVNPEINAQTVYSQDADFYKASIQLNSTLGFDWVENNVEATTGDGSMMPMSIHPYLGGIKLTGYPLQDQFHKPQLITFDLNEYLAMDPSAQDTVDALKALLAAEGQAIPMDGKLPFFPMFPANQVFHTQAKILHHQNGSGLRYLTMYSQAFLAVDNYSLFYTYQGLSSDGKTYVIAILPIKASILPEQQDLPADPQAFIDSYDTYLGEVSSGLNALAPEQFTPNLDEIDRMIETLRLW
jgi:hypothetical protein